MQEDGEEVKVNAAQMESVKRELGNGRLQVF